MLDRAVRRIRVGPEEAGDRGVGGFHPIALGPRAGVQFMRALEGGRSLLVLLDQRARGDEGLPVEFFGRPARTRKAPIALADRAGAAVLCAFTVRMPNGRHRLEIDPPLQLASGASDDEDVLRRNLQQVTAEIENAIRATPEQWIWTHRRWREPDGGVARAG